MLVAIASCVTLQMGIPPEEWRVGPLYSSILDLAVNFIVIIIILNSIYPFISCWGNVFIRRKKVLSRWPIKHKIRFLCFIGF